MALACQELVRYPSFKLLIVGDAGTANIHVVVHPMNFRTDYGQMMFYCWDTDGHEAELFRGDWGEPERKFYESPSCAIIMFDVTSRATYDNVPEWYRIIRRLDERIPIVICGNKVDDVKNRQVKPADITFHPYYEISAKGSYNFEKPFLYLARWMARYISCKPSFVAF
ncbi:hypothetical protein MKX03_018661 [Papaver bracteatum]|nr:hypothetical protein MKX03_018661 [Papaver bracteatum]